MSNALIIISCKSCWDLKLLQFKHQGPQNVDPPLCTSNQNLYQEVIIIKASPPREQTITPCFIQQLIIKWMADSWLLFPTENNEQGTAYHREFTVSERNAPQQMYSHVTKNGPILIYWMCINKYFLKQLLWTHTYATNRLSMIFLYLSSPLILK